MLIFPAIDLKDGKVVRLHQGSFDTVHQVADDPVATARTFYDAGARHLHMVDLEGEKSAPGRRKGWRAQKQRHSPCRCQYRAENRAGRRDPFHGGHPGGV